MSEDNNIKNHFRNYIAEEKRKEGLGALGEDHIIFLKLLWYNFDEILPKKKNPRKIFLLEQIEKYLTDINYRHKIDYVELPDHEQIINTNEETVVNAKLKELNLVNFRGFQTNESGSGRKINFSEKATFFYAPNGGGKTSLCEALEWALTGDSTERKKRKADALGAYYQNNNKEKPIFNGTQLLSTDGVVKPNPAYDRCFLEKNRIDKFACLAIQPNNEFQNALGELFGLTDVIEFFKEFVQNLSPTQTEATSVASGNWSLWLDWDIKKRDIEKYIDEAIKDEKAENEKLILLIGDKSVVDKQNEIDSDIKKCEEEIEALGKIYCKKFSAVEFDKLIEQYIVKINEWRALENNIKENAKDLEFESLYQAADLIFKKYKANKCPLCDTPFKQTGSFFWGRSGVFTDPIEKTKNELTKLKKLTELKNAKASIENELKGISFRAIRDELDKIGHNLIEDNWKIIAAGKNKPEIYLFDVNQIESIIDGDMSIFVDLCEKTFKINVNVLMDIENVVNEYLIKQDNILTVKSDKEKRLKSLIEERKILQDQSTTLSAKQKIKGKYENDLQKLINQESNKSKFNKLLKMYSSIYVTLQEYPSSMITKEGADIDATVTGFYRALNMYDHEGEIVDDICLPKSKQEEFYFKYAKDLNKKCNTLHILSEGHLRTLGLSVLLARAVKYSMPILIFDDAINAIDSDHRDNIACLLSGKYTDIDGKVVFRDKWDQVKTYLKDCQFVITTHDRFFDEKVSNLFNKDKQLRYVLYAGKNGIDYCEKGVPANFDAKIGQYLSPETQDIRSAIFYCRIWLEEILLGIAVDYVKPSNKKKIEFSNIIDKKTKCVKNPELVTLIDNLKSNLSKSANQEDKEIAEILDKIYKEKDGNYLWIFNILNQESHYRRFEHVDISNATTSKEVKTIYNKIQEINSLANKIN